MKSKSFTTYDDRAWAIRTFQRSFDRYHEALAEILRSFGRVVINKYYSDPSCPKEVPLDIVIAYLRYMEKVLPEKISKLQAIINAGKQGKKIITDYTYSSIVSDCVNFWLEMEGLKEFKVNMDLKDSDDYDFSLICLLSGVLTSLNVFNTLVQHEVLLPTVQKHFQREIFKSVYIDVIPDCYCREIPWWSKFAPKSFIPRIKRRK